MLYAVMWNDVTIIRFTRKRHADEFVQRHNSTEVPLTVIEQLDAYYNTVIIFEYYVPSDDFCKGLIAYRVRGAECSEG